MTTSYQTLGGATAIPAFGGGYLPEASVVPRQIWVELWGNTANISTATDWIATARINGGTTINWWDEESALLSGRWAYGVIDITAEDLTSARSLEIIVTGITNRLTQMGGMVCITYEFDPDATTTVYNSLFLGGVDSVAQMGGTAVGDEDNWTRDLRINEPATITMKESGVALFFNDSVALTINVAVGAQADKAYAFTASTTQNGQYSVVHRIDAGGQVGTAGMTLARGANEYNIQSRSATAAAGWNLSGFLLLNYTSAKASDGVGSHAQSRYFHLADTAADTQSRQVTNLTVPTIPESWHYLVGAVVDIDAMTPSTASAALSLLLERTGGLGWDPAYIGMYRADAETGFITPFGAARSIWQRWPDDPEATRADPETSRAWRLNTVPSMWASWGVWMTWNAHEWTIAGTVSGYVDADGAGLTVNIHRAATGELVKTVTTTAGGAFTTPWFDDTEALYAVVYEDATHVGRSANLTAT
jgi:hypothetical protein